jgi:hypothetical protein
MSFPLLSWRHLAFLSLLIVTAVLAEEIIVRMNGVDVHEKKITMSAIVGTLNSGDHLQVLERQSDGWLRVKVGDREGYVKASKLEEPRGGGFGDLLKNSQFEAHAEASDPTASMAARGLRDGAIVYSRAKNLNPAPLSTMIDTRRSVVGARYDQFTREGNVGPR